jgi:hypothetical protein
MGQILQGYIHYLFFVVHLQPLPQTMSMSPPVLTMSPPVLTMSPPDLTPLLFILGYMVDFASKTFVKYSLTPPWQYKKHVKITFSTF